MKANPIRAAAATVLACCRTNSRRPLCALALALGAASLVSCGPYSFSGSAYPHIKTIAIPLLDDQTAEFGIKEGLTNSLIDAFSRDNSLKIGDRRTADSILRGTIRAVGDRAGGYDASERVDEIQVQVVVELSYEDVKKRKTIWEDTITQFGTYRPGASEKNRREDAISEAIAKITEEVLNRTVSGGW